MAGGLQYLVRSVQEDRSVSRGRSPNTFLDHMVSSSTTAGLEAISTFEEGEMLTPRMTLTS